VNHTLDWSGDGIFDILVCAENGKLSYYDRPCINAR